MRDKAVVAGVLLHHWVADRGAQENQWAIVADDRSDREAGYTGG